MPIDPLTGLYYPAPGEFATDGPGVTPRPTRDFGDRLFGDSLLGDSLQDIALSPLRATEGLARGVLGMVDILPGVETGVAKERWFGRSETKGGAFLENGLTFMVPFGAFARGIKAAGTIANAARFGRTAIGATYAGRGESVRRVLRATAAGVGADFVTWGGAEARFSTLLAEWGVGGAVTEYLAGDPDDTELEGRFKNVLEGAGLGVMLDSVVALFGAIRKGKAVARKGGTPDEQAAAMNAEAEARGLPDAARASLEGADEQARILREWNEGEQRAADEFGNELVDRQLDDPATAGRVRTAPQSLETDAADAVRARLERASRKLRDPEERAKFHDDLLTGRVNPATEMLADIRARGLLTPNQIRRAIGMGRAFLEENRDQFRTLLGGDPRQMEDDVLAAIGLADEGMNLRHLVDDDGDTLALIRGFERYMADNGVKLRTSKQTEADMLMAGSAVGADLLQESDESFTLRAASYVGDTKRVSTLAVAWRLVMATYAANVAKIAAHVRGRKVMEAPELERLGLAGKDAQGLLDELHWNHRRMAVAASASGLGASNLGRGLRALQVPVSGQVLDIVKGTDFADGASVRAALGDEDYERLIDALASTAELPALNRLTAIQRFAELPFHRQLLGWATEWFIQALMSSPKTIVTNLAMPLATSTYLPLEGMLGGAVRGAIGKAVGSPGGFENVGRELRTLQGMYLAVGEAATASLRVLKSGVKYGTDNTKRDDPYAFVDLFSPEVFDAVFPGGRWSPGTPGAALIHYFGTMVNLPGRLMASTDQFVKTLTARGYVYGELYENARRAGDDPVAVVPGQMDKVFRDGRLATDEYVQEVVARRLRDAGITDPVQAIAARPKIEREVKEELDFDALNPITKAALERANVATATADLPEGSFGASYQALVRNHPVLRLVTPFVRTPVNLLKFAGERSVGPVISVPSAIFRKIASHKGWVKTDNIEAIRSRNVRQLLSNDPRQQAEAAGRLAVAVGAFATVVGYAQAGLITGGGPADPEKKRLLEASGWLPYSVRSGDTYVQYLRTDPFSIVMGLTADLVETTKLALVEDDDVLGVLSSAILHSMTENLVNRTYMAGLRTALDATRGEHYMKSFLGNMAAGFTIPRLFQAIAAVQDPVLKDAHTLLEIVRSRTPGVGGLTEGSKAVPPLRNVLGEVVERSHALGADPDSPASLWLDLFGPIAYREVKDKEVLAELASLNHGFAPPRATKFGVDLRSHEENGRQAYDRWLELHGEVRLHGRSLRAELKRLFRSPTYRALPRESSPELSSPRVRLIRAAIGEYREAAFQALLKESPGLRAAVQATAQDGARVRAGLDPLNPLPGLPTPFRNFAE